MPLSPCFCATRVIITGNCTINLVNISSPHHNPHRWQIGLIKLITIMGQCQATRRVTLNQAVLFAQQDFEVEVGVVVPTRRHPLNPVVIVNLKAHPQFLHLRSCPTVTEWIIITHSRPRASPVFAALSSFKAGSSFPWRFHFSSLKTISFFGIWSNILPGMLTPSKHIIFFRMMPFSDTIRLSNLMRPHRCVYAVLSTWWMVFPFAFSII